MVTDEKIQVFFRFDDITALSNLNFEKQLFNIFHQNETVCSVGVVPEVTKGNFEDPTPTGTASLSNKKIEFFHP